MTTPTDRAYGIAARELLAGITGIWDLDLFREALERRAAEIDAGKPECPTCSGRGEIGGFVSMDSGYQSDPCPECSTSAHAEAVEVLPDFHAWLDRDWPLWRNDEDHPSISRLQRCWEAALAARPAAVGGDDDECQLSREAHLRIDNILMSVGAFSLAYEGGNRAAWENTIGSVANLAQRPQQLAVTGEKPLTASQLADALGCFWNAAIGADVTQHDSTAKVTVSGIAVGIAAIETRLREFDDWRYMARKETA